MKSKRRGYTLVEVSLFLAVTGLLFVGVALGVQNSMYQQRFNDAVQSYAEFLRTAYSEVMNVENPVGYGNSEIAIYGKMLKFEAGEGDAVYSYDVVGSVSDESVGNTLDALSSVGAAACTGDAIVMNEQEIVCDTQVFRPKWQSEIQVTDSKKLFKGAVLIVRDPSSGTVFTYINNTDDNITIAKSDESNFKLQGADFCISMDNGNNLNARRDVRIIENARNVSGVEVIAMDGDENKCRGGNS